MSLQTRLASLISAIGADIKDIYTRLSGVENSVNTPVNPINLPEMATPATPTSNRTLLYPKSDANWYSKNDFGIETNLSDLMLGGRGWAIPKPGSASIDSLGCFTPSATGTMTAAARSLTNKHQRSRRVDFLVTASTLNAVAGWRSTTAHLVRGNASGVGGFSCTQVWGPATGVSVTTNRAFVGLTAGTSAPTDVEPSTQLNCIGMGWDAADTNVQIMHNDGSGTATKVDLGSSFPVPTADRTALYQLDLWCAPNDSRLYWRVLDLVSGAVSQGSTGVSTKIPSNTTYLADRGWISNGGVMSVIGIAFCGTAFQTEPF